MNRRVIILLLIIVILAGGAGVYFLTGIGKPPTGTTDAGGGQGTGGSQITQPTQTPIKVAKIVVAIQPISRGQRIIEGMVDLREWPVNAIPVNARTAIEDVIKRPPDLPLIARTDIAVEQPILSTLLVEDITKVAPIASDAGAVIPPGLVAIAVPIDRMTSVGYAVHDGDHVDVLLSLLFVDVDEEFQSKKPNLVTLVTIKQDGTIEFQKGIQGRFEASSFSQFPVVVGPSEPQRPRLVVQRTIQSALVIHVGLFPLDGQFIGKPPATPTSPPVEGEPTKGPPPPTPTPAFPDQVTLAVTPQEASVLLWAVETRIPMTLTLRSAQDQSTSSTTAVTLQYILDTYAIQQPPKLPFALEPAITSIRRLILGGNEISLNGSGTASGQ